MKKFGRVLTAMVTPFTANYAVDYEQAKVLARYLVDNGSDGLVVAGTTGESPTLSFEEKLQMYSVVKAAVGDRATIIAGTGSNDTAGTIKLTKAAEQSGVDGVMLIVPYYNKPSQEGMYRHFAAVAENTTLPIMLYNVPGRTAVNLLPATVVKLAQIPNIVALKEAAGSTDQATELKRLLPDDFMVYSGDDSMTLPLMALGCEGIVSVVSHVVGREVQAMVQAYLRGDVQAAAKIHADLYPIFKGMFMTSNPVPVKTALNLLGMDVGPVRLPLIEASEKETMEIQKLLQHVGKELADNRAQAAGAGQGSNLAQV